MGAVISRWMILEPGQSVTYDFSLHQEQYDHQPGRHRIVLTGLAGGFVSGVYAGLTTGTSAIQEGQMQQASAPTYMYGVSLRLFHTAFKRLARFESG